MTWENLPDKPFCDVQTVIEWDGSTEGRETSGDAHYHVSGETPTVEDLSNGVFIVSMEDGSTMDMAITDDSNNMDTEENVFHSMGVCVAYIDGATYGGVIFPKAGVYFLHQDGMGYVSKLTYDSIKTIEEKFIPDSIARKDDIPGSIGGVSSWDELLDKPDTLPNPKGLIFTGAASAYYDGSEEVSIEIPTQKNITVNGVTPDENNNIEIDIPAMPEVPVISVNGMTGDVVIDIPEQVQSDWSQNDITKSDHIKNRTHWEELITNTIEWDGENGDVSELEYFINSDIGTKYKWYKLSDDPVIVNGVIPPHSLDVVAQGNVIHISKDDTLKDEYQNAWRESSGGWYFGYMYIGTEDDVIENSGSILSVEKEHIIHSGTGTIYVGRGTYFLYSEGDIENSIEECYVRKFEYDTVAVHTLDDKFIPDTIARKSDGTSAWSEIEDKPFHVGKALNVVEWNGNKDNVESFTISKKPYNNKLFIKISDNVPSKDELNKAKYDAVFDVGSYNTTILMEDMEDGTNCYLVYGIDLLVVNDLTVIDPNGYYGVAPSRGMYLADVGSQNPFKSVRIEYNASTEKINTTCLPNGGFGWTEIGETIVEWDGNTEDRDSFDLDSTMYKVSDLTPSCEDLVGCTVGIVNIHNGVTDEDTVECGAGQINEIAPGVVQLGNGLVCVVNLTEEQRAEFGIPSNGIYIYYAATDDLTVYVKALTYGSTVVHPLDEKFIPDSVKVPAVTAEDNGAFLRVIDGAWAVVKMTDVSVEGA